MWAQIRAIAWAQWRITRNHLPRTGAGTWLMAILGLLWYCGFAFLAWAILRVTSVIDPGTLAEWLPAGLLGVCVFWQLVPLFTLTGGWSLDLKKLQSFPVPTSTFFGIELLLRVTTAFEMLMVAVGGAIGLMLNPALPKAAGLLLLLIIPLNLLVSLALREFILRSFARNRLREIFALVVVSIGLVPQLLLRTPLGQKASPAALSMSRTRGLPWTEIGRLATGHFSAASFGAIALWLTGAYLFARWSFAKGLREEDGIRAAPSRLADPSRGKRGVWESLVSIPEALFSDPLAILIQKELRSLVRMPRFRVIFGMACLFGVLVFLPLSESNASFMHSNFPQVVSLYGVLILSDALFWNIFGFDRAAAQLYFAAPVDFRRVIQAKNLAAVLIVAGQNTIVLLVAMLLRFAATPLSTIAGLCATAVVIVFFLSAGNLSSVTTPRYADPAQTLKRQTSGQRQLWLLGCSLGMFVLVGLGLLARWAAGTDWALIGVLAVEFGIGCIVFRVALDSAVARGLARREEILDALSKSGSQVAL